MVYDCNSMPVVRDCKFKRFRRNDNFSTILVSRFLLVNHHVNV